MEASTRRTGALIAAGLFLGVTGLAAACRQEQAYKIPSTPVQVTTVGAYKGSAGVTYAANIVPYSQVILSFKSGGYVQSLRQVKGK